MTNRRNFLGALIRSSGAGLAMVARHLCAAVFKSHDDVPRRVDIRETEGGVYIPVDIYRRGKKQEHVVAYDLDAQTITRYRSDPNGNIVITGNEFDYVVESGGVVVLWQNRA